METQDHSSVMFTELTQFQRKGRQRAAQLLHECGLGSAQVPRPQDVTKIQQQARAAGVPADTARRLHENYVVATFGDEMVGAARFHPSLEWLQRMTSRGASTDELAAAGRRSMLAHMAVLPQHRGQGIGAKLLAFVVDTARTNGSDLLWGFAEASNVPDRKPTPQENDRLRDFYVRQGFTVGGGSFDTPREIYGRDAAFTITNRVGTYFWKVL